MAVCVESEVGLAFQPDSNFVILVRKCDFRRFRQRC